MKGSSGIKGVVNFQSCSAYIEAIIFADFFNYRCVIDWDVEETWTDTNIIYGKKKEI